MLPQQRQPSHLARPGLAFQPTGDAYDPTFSAFRPTRIPPKSIPSVVFSVLCGTLLSSSNPLNHFLITYLIQLELCKSHTKILVAPTPKNGG